MRQNGRICMSRYGYERGNQKVSSAPMHCCSAREAVSASIAIPLPPLAATPIRSPRLKSLLRTIVRWTSVSNARKKHSRQTACAVFGRRKMARRGLVRLHKAHGAIVQPGGKRLAWTRDVKGYNYEGRKADAIVQMRSRAGVHQVFDTTRYPSPASSSAATASTA